MNFEIELGEKLEDLRKDRSIKMMRHRNLSLESIGETIGISKSALSEYENGKKRMGFENAVKLAQFYGVSLDYLAGLTEPINLDTSMIHQKTGLSLEAIEALYTAPDNVCNFISDLLESSHLQGLVQDLEQQKRLRMNCIRLERETTTDGKHPQN